MLRFVALLALLSLAPACAHTGTGTGPPPSPLDRAITGLNVAAFAAALTETFAVAGGSGEACLGARVVKTVAVGALEGLQFRQTLPGLAIDVSPCLKLSGITPASPIPEKFRAAVVSIADDASGPVLSALHAVLDGQNASCPEEQWASAITSYILGGLSAVAAELADPDGVVAVPAVAVDFTPCGQ